MGRRKISIAPIADDRNRSVTFLKRKNGLFKKAYELGVLCSADVAVIVFSNTGKLFEFHSGDMDQILLRYSHYSGLAYEKKGPEDYASKDVDEIAKLGLGGKMTVLDQAARAAAAEEEDEMSDESGGEEKKVTPAPAAKSKGKAAPRGKSASASASVAKSEVSEQQQESGHDENYGYHDPTRMGSMAPGQAPPGAFGQLPFGAHGFPGYPGGFPSLPILPGQQQPQFGQQPQQQPGWPYGQPNGGARPGQPPMGMAMGGQQPWMNPAAAAQHQLPPWAMQAAAFGGLGGPPGSGAPAMAGMPGFAMPDFGLLQQAYQQSQQGPGGSFFGAGGQGGVPGYSPQHPLANLGLAQQQQQQQLAQLQQQQLQQHQQAAHLAQQQQQQASSPANVATPETAAGSPMMQSRPGSVASQSRTEGGPSRSNSSANKPRLSVNIPGEEGAGGGGAVTQEGGNGVYTAEPEGMEDEDGSRTAHPDRPARYASDILPSPSNFLADIPYSAGGGYSLSGLNTAIAMASDDPSNDSGGSVFTWPASKSTNDVEERRDGYGPAPMLGEEEGRDLFGLGGDPEDVTERQSRSLKRGSQDEGDGRESEEQETVSEEGGRRTRARR